MIRGEMLNCRAYTVLRSRASKFWSVDWPLRASRRRVARMIWRLAHKLMMVSANPTIMSWFVCPSLTAKDGFQITATARAEKMKDIRVAVMSRTERECFAMGFPVCRGGRGARSKGSSSISSTGAYCWSLIALIAKRQGNFKRELHKIRAIGLTSMQQVMYLSLATEKTGIWPNKYARLTDGGLETQWLQLAQANRHVFDLSPSENHRRPVTDEWKGIKMCKDLSEFTIGKCVRPQPGYLPHHLVTKINIE